MIDLNIKSPTSHSALSILEDSMLTRFVSKNIRTNIWVDSKDDADFMHSFSLNINRNTVRNTIAGIYTSIYFPSLEKMTQRKSQNPIIIPVVTINHQELDIYKTMDFIRQIADLNLKLFKKLGVFQQQGQTAMPVLLYNENLYNMEVYNQLQVLPRIIHRDTGLSIKYALDFPKAPEKRVWRGFISYIVNHMVPYIIWQSNPTELPCKQCTHGMVVKNGKFYGCELMKHYNFDIEKVSERKFDRLYEKLRKKNQRINIGRRKVYNKGALCMYYPSYFNKFLYYNTQYTNFNK